MSLLGEVETGVVEKPATPRDSEDLLSMLRTRWSDGAFSDIKVSIFNREYSLHRVVLCRSTFFDRLLQGNWNETHDKVVKLEVPSAIITCEAFELALSHMYANPVMLNRNNILQVIAAASYLGLSDLYEQASDYIVESMCDPEFFLEFYCRGNLLEYGTQTDKIQKAGWQHLCIMGSDHLRQVLPHLDIQTVKRLLQCEELWIKTELDRYNLAKEVLLPKLIEARRHCQEHAGLAGMPNWLDPALGSPRDPWMPPYRESTEFTGDNKNMYGSGGSNNNSSAHNHFLDSAEIKEDTSGANESLLGSREVGNRQRDLEGIDDEENTQLRSLLNGDAGPSSPRPAIDDRSSHGENSSEHRGDEEEEGIVSGLTRDTPEDLQRNSKAFQVFNSKQVDASYSAGNLVSEVAEIFNAVSEVFGSEGIKYSHIQHTDLCNIEMELRDLGLNRSQYALLQGMRTQDVLYKRIEACSAVEEQEQQTGRSMNYPRNLHPYSPKDIEDIYSRWTLPSFRFGVEFKDVENIEPQSEQISEAHYYAGSIWKVRLLIDDKKNEVRLHLFRNQRKVGRIGGVQTVYDSREVVCTRFKFLVPSRDGMAARSSRPGRFQQKKGRGWNDFLKWDNVKGYLTPWGSLRIIVIVYPPFESD